jgi:hypothetical protein
MTMSTIATSLAVSGTTKGRISHCGKENEMMPPVPVPKVSVSATDFRVTALPIHDTSSRCSTDLMVTPHL